MDVNTPAHAEAYFASAMLDAIYVPVNFRARAAEVNQMLERVAPGVVLAGIRYTELIDSCDCIGELVGEEHRGISIMFELMNAARVGVGLQGVALGSWAYLAA